MRKQVFVALLVGLLVMPLPAEASWITWRHKAEQCLLGWEEKTVTEYRKECKTRLVPKVVTKSVAKTIEEPYKYTELVPVTVAEKRNVTEHQCVTKEVPYTYSVKVPVVTAEKRTITTYECVAKKIPYTYTVKVPVQVTEKRSVTEWITVEEKVCKEKPVHRLAKVEIVDPCTGCSRTALKFVTETKFKESVKKHKVPQTKEVLVNVCTHKTEERTGEKVVYEKVAVPKEITVNVHSCKTEQRTGVKRVQEKVPVTKEITVNVTKCQPVERTGVKKRVICENVQETIQVAEKYVELVPVVKTLKVPVYGKPACSSCQ